jgi:hypothetical protein
MASTAIRLERPDAVALAYVEWHKQAYRVRQVYEAWRTAERVERSCRFAAYLEQLDREQRACELYAVALSHSAASHGTPARRR